MAKNGTIFYDDLRESSVHWAELARSLDVLDDALRIYGPGGISVAFNGGKDATVVLHLTRACISNWVRHNNDANNANDTPSTTKSRVRCLYLPSDDEFSSVEKFVREQVKKYRLDSMQIGGGFRQGIEDYLKLNTCSAFIMGTRMRDPYASAMEHFEPSSKGWPIFMRVNPILKWDYEMVWRFLRRFEIPYCEMYDRGYTSIGNVSTTVQNPALKTVDKDGQMRYLPACQLKDHALERAGRITREVDNERRKGREKDLREEKFCNLVVPNGERTAEET